LVATVENSLSGRADRAPLSRSVTLVS
jgi:hypothetical protein